VAGFLDRLLAENRRERAKLDARAAAVDARERDFVAGCEAERREIDDERAALEKVERIYRRDYVPSLDETEIFEDPSSDTLTDSIQSRLPHFASQAMSEQGTKPKARIGDKRYRMFHALRKCGSAGLEDLVHNTGEDIKRIKAQMSSDVTDGFVVRGDSGSYTLTKSGTDLLDRFEAYRRAKGEDLPPLNEPALQNQIKEDDGEGDIA